MAPAPTLLTIPPEIRELIYAKVLAPRAVRLPINSLDGTDDLTRWRYDLRLLRTSRQVRAEARRVLRRRDVFIAIETPWPEAADHVTAEGRVPLVANGERGRAFGRGPDPTAGAHLRVWINLRPNLPDYQPPSDPRPQRFIILRADLPAFCQMWFYSNLGYSGLNGSLRLELELRDPYADTPEGGTTEKDGTAIALPKALQRQLLEPFGLVKSLDKVTFKGPHDADIEDALRREMAVPPTPPEQCLEEGTRLKDEGNAVLQAGRPRDALAIYKRAFHAIHIEVAGRRRRVWADAHFSGELTSGTFKGQEGLLVRFVLRAKLVANTVLAYVKLSEWTEARFWGMRSIRLVEDGFEESQQGPGFVAATELGKIYYRTALASHELGDDSEARRLLANAAKYLPNDQVVRKEIEARALKLM